MGNAPFSHHYGIFNGENGTVVLRTIFPFPTNIPRQIFPYPINLGRIKKWEWDHDGFMGIFVCQMGRIQ